MTLLERGISTLVVACALLAGVGSAVAQPLKPRVILFSGSLV
jgi:hypothetical protein